MTRPPKLGDLLVQAGLIDEFQLEAALGHQRRFGNRLGVAVVKLGFLREEDLLAMLGRQLGLPIVRLAGKRISPDVLSRVPALLIEKHGCLPLFVRREQDRDVLYLGTADPCDRGALDDVARAVGMALRPVLVAPTDLHEAVCGWLRARNERSDMAFVERPETEDTTPLLPAEERDGAGPDAAAEHPAARVSRPRDVATRVILHALTQLLVEKGVIQRGALVARVEALERAKEE
jgi:type IV pilus assembly protein PilB